MATDTKATEFDLDAMVAGINQQRAELAEKRSQLMDEVRGIDQNLRRLNTALKALDPSAATNEPRTTGLDAVRAAMTELGTATQMQVAKHIGKPKNSAKTGLEKLVAEGFIKPTGRTVARSPEFALADGAA